MIRVARYFIAIFLLPMAVHAQSVEQKLRNAYAVFEKDPQLKHAISSLHVVDAKSGKVLFSKNANVGLAPASTQKIITSVSVYELLGKNYIYKTEMGYAGTIKDSIAGSIVIRGSGDPSFGSFRFKSTNTDSILNRFTDALAGMGISFAYAPIFILDYGWSSQSIPDGWIWEDLGNYYGAGSSSIIWRENQYDIILRSGSKIGDPVRVVKTEPSIWKLKYNSEVTSAAAGTGDNAYIYLPVNSDVATIRGTIPVNQSEFTISGSMPHGERQFEHELRDRMRQKKIGTIAMPHSEYKEPPKEFNTIYTHYSPSMDTLIYWFNRRSINLYGEAFVKTLSYEKYKWASTDSGISVIRNFWRQNGIEKEELNIVDGSGLSPLNRVTTRALVEILEYASKREWFPSFYHALPEGNNDMKLKSGTIRGVKGYAGYYKAKNGREYIISFLVNNYNGSASGVVTKMFKVLNALR